MRIGMIPRVGNRYSWGSLFVVSYGCAAALNPSHPNKHDGSQSHTSSIEILFARRQFRII